MYDVVQRGRKVPYFFDEPTMKKKITIRTPEMPPKFQYEFNFDKVEQNGATGNEAPQAQPDWDVRAMCVLRTSNAQVILINSII